MKNYYKTLREALTKEKATREQMGLNFGYKEEKSQMKPSLQELVIAYQESQSDMEKMVILQEIEAIRGTIPMDLQMDMKAGKTR